MHQHSKNSLLSCFSPFFTPLSDIHERQTKSKTKSNFYLPKFSTRRCQRSSKYHEVKIWNSLSPELRNQSFKSFKIKSKIKSSLYSPYYAEACNELRGPFPRLSAWATQLRRNVATVASRWRHCVDLTGPGIEPQTSRTDSVRFATELTAGKL